MKIFLYKFLFFLIITLSVQSCTKEDTLSKMNTANEQNSNSFIFDDKISNYFVDGVLEYDRSKISSASKDAWNIHFDYPKNKVVISTTPEAFEKYKKSNLEFKKGFEKSMVEDNAGQIQNSSSTSRDSFDDYTVDDVNEKVALWLTYSKKGSDGKTYFYAYHGFISSDGDLTSYILNRNSFKDISYASEADQPNVTRLQINFYSIIYNDSDYPNAKLAISNDKPQDEAQVTFYKNLNYGGNSITVTIPPKTGVKIANVENFDPKSQKRNY